MDVYQFMQLASFGLALFMAGYTLAKENNRPKQSIRCGYLNRSKG